MKFQNKTQKFLIILTLSAPLPFPALGADTTIDDERTTTQGPTNPPLNGNDSLTITTSGSISTNTNNTGGIDATGGSNQITNNGAIKTKGDSADGIAATGGASVITNNGVMRTEGTSARAIAILGNSNIIINNGAIETGLSTGINTGAGRAASLHVV